MFQKVKKFFFLKKDNLKHLHENFAALQGIMIKMGTIFGSSYICE
jgi:hypothetical protein